MSSDRKKDSFSVNLNEAFEDYRNTKEYKMQLEERKKSLEVLWIFEPFAKALAEDSLDTWIRVSELLEVKDEIFRENKRLMDLINLTPDPIIDLTNRLSNNRIYWWTWLKAA